MHFIDTKGVRHREYWIPTIWVSRSSMVAVVVFATALVLPVSTSKLSKPCAMSQELFAY
jgi:hypothetical protein